MCVYTYMYIYMFIYEVSLVISQYMHVFKHVECHKYIQILLVPLKVNREKEAMFIKSGTTLTALFIRTD